MAYVSQAIPYCLINICTIYTVREYFQIIRDQTLRERGSTNREVGRREPHVKFYPCKKKRGGGGVGKRRHVDVRHQGPLSERVSPSTYVFDGGEL